MAVLSPLARKPTSRFEPGSRSERAARPLCACRNRLSYPSSSPSKPVSAGSTTHRSTSQLRNGVYSQQPCMSGDCSSPSATQPLARALSPPDFPSSYHDGHIFASSELIGTGFGAGLISGGGQGLICSTSRSSFFYNGLAEFSPRFLLKWETSWRGSSCSSRTSTGAWDGCSELFEGLGGVRELLRICLFSFRKLPCGINERPVK